MRVLDPIARAAVTCALASSVLASAPVQRGAPPVRSPREVWRVAGNGHGRPTVGEGVVYFLSASHQVLALDRATGKQIWSSTTGEPGPATLGSSVALAGRLLVAGDYNVAAFDRYSGALRWRFTPALGYGPGVYLGDMDDRLVMCGSPSGRVYALRATTGELAWSAPLLARAAVTIFQPRIYDDVVVAGFTVFEAPPTGGVAAFDRATGHELWRAMFPRAPDPLLGTGFASGPLFAGDEVLVSSADGRIHAFARKDGALRWSVAPLPGIPAVIRGPLPPLQDDAGGADFRGLVISGSTLVAGSFTGPVAAYDLRSRREVWRYDDPRSGSALLGLAADDRTVYVPFASGQLVAIDAGNGEERWRTDPRDGFTWPAAFDELRVYLSGRSGYVALVKSSGI